MHVDEGIMKVIDTEGDNHLGGKNIDSAIVDELLIPALESIWDLQNTLSDAANKRLLQEALKRPAEEAKIALSSRPSYSASLEDLLDDSGDEMTEDIQISLKEYEDVCGPIFQKAIDICLSLLKRNGLSTEDLTSVILVGGPTFSQTLRRMVKEQITPRLWALHYSHRQGPFQPMFRNETPPRRS
jgi:molecular chaperone DnaK